MRPFRFFFALSLGLFVFFFLARLVLLALFAAAVMSLVFFLGRKVKNFFQRLSWEEDHYDAPSFRNNYRRAIQRPIWKDDLLVEYPAMQAEYLPNYKVIQVR